MSKIIQRIRKLLALAESANVNEAAVAAAAAQRLIDQHRIDCHALDDPDPWIVVFDDHPLGAAIAWNVDLAIAVAEANACRVAIDEHARLRLVGSPVETAAVRVLVAYLSGEISRLAKVLGHDDPSFGYGAVAVVERRLREARQIRVRPVARRSRSSTTTLVRARSDARALARRGAEADALLAAVISDPETIELQARIDLAAWTDGAAAAHLIDLVTQPQIAE